jgi:8-oxo-dGTP pyrophosphatase MutT (NUDIX family)
MHHRAMSVRPGEKHHTTAVFLISDEAVPRVLLIDHKKLKVWMPPGGHVEVDENPFDGAIREVFEETGLDIRAHIETPTKVTSTVTSFPMPAFLYEEIVPVHGNDPEHIHLDYVYIFHIPHREPVLNTDETHGVRWFTREEALAVSLLDDVRQTLEEIL